MSSCSRVGPARILPLIARGQILSFRLGDIVDSAWHKVVVPARQAMQLGGPYNSNARVDYIPQSGTKNLASGLNNWPGSSILLNCHKPWGVYNIF